MKPLRPQKRPRPNLLLSLSIAFFFLGPLPHASKGLAHADEKKTPNPEILRGIHLLYDYQFDAAEKAFENLVHAFPRRPEGHFYSAMVTWCRLASGFWTPDMVREYVRRVDRTVRVAKKRIKESGGDSYDYFYLGGALGFKGRFELSRGHYLSAFFCAMEAIDGLKRCREMDPDNRDVLLGLGIFDYYTARLSGVLRFLSYLLMPILHLRYVIKKANNEFIWRVDHMELRYKLCFLVLSFDSDSWRFLFHTLNLNP